MINRQDKMRINCVEMRTKNSSYDMTMRVITCL